MCFDADREPYHNSAVMVPGHFLTCRAAVRSNGKVVLRGTTAVELASAFNWYLNEYLNATYDWNTVGCWGCACPYLAHHLSVMFLRSTPKASFLDRAGKIQALEQAGHTERRSTTCPRHILPR